MLPTIRRNALNLRTIPEFRWDVDRLFDEIINRPSAGYPLGGPAADLYETEDGFTLEMNLPGYELDNIDVNLEQGVLLVSGVREEDTEEERGTYHLRERSWGRFNRSFTVPHTIDPKAVKAEFTNGVLIVNLPKAPDAKARRIEVKVK
ncbi:MAG: Hsp20/alpha crystallin family protein [Gemmatimonadota bacterium]|nr:Hsp20/alpha crystallin family protein [Gemmatimonadota bacterium]MDH3427763.1 Hsp20/alpha crystallin family protein [Gemmatimonadota bacterium]